MKKRYLLLLMGMLAVCSVSGCGKSGSDETEAASEAAGAEITGYLVDGADQYVTLGTYKGMDVEQPIYTVSDDEVAMEVDATLYEYSTVETVDGLSRRATCYGRRYRHRRGRVRATLSEEDYTVELGYEEFGADFDQQMIGAQAGDEKEFSTLSGKIPGMKSGLTRRSTLK